MTDDFPIDLHMHSSFSDDGEIAPETLAAMAAGAGLRCVALCDHNNADGNGPFLDAARRLGLTAVPCVELDCAFSGVGLHVLGYFVDYGDARFAAVRDDVKERERAVSGRRVGAIRRLGIVLDDDRLAELAPDGSVIGEIIAEAALENPANDGNPLLAPFRPGGARADNPFVNFYWDFCSAGKPGHVAIDYMTLESAVRLIADAGGVPVLAHPGQSLKGRERLVDDVAARGVRGLEAYSSYHSPEQRAHWLGEAERLGLFVTCGSDFHGKTKPAIALGRHGAEGRGREIARSLFAAAGKEFP